MAELEDLSSPDELRQIAEAKEMTEIKKLLARRRKIEKDAERYQRSEKVRVAALAKMSVRGVWTRKVKAVTEELWGHSFSASPIRS